ncbi:hypothetical protein X975_18481, partial [Stegodyphus mimosarum]
MNDSTATNASQMWYGLSNETCSLTYDPRMQTFRQLHLSTRFIVLNHRSLIPEASSNPCACFVLQGPHLGPSVETAELNS